MIHIPAGSRQQVQVIASLPLESSAKLFGGAANTNCLFIPCPGSLGTAAVGTDLHDCQSTLIKSLFPDLAWSRALSEDSVLKSLAKVLKNNL